MIKLRNIGSLLTNCYKKEEQLGSHFKKCNKKWSPNNANAANTTNDANI